MLHSINVNTINLSFKANQYRNLCLIEQLILKLPRTQNLIIQNIKKLQISFRK